MKLFDENPEKRIPTNYGALTTLITVFFFWGFVAAGNGIFIPFCKTHFQLNQFQSQLIDTAYYGAYFYGSLFLYFISQFRGIDLLNRIGYKKGIIWGLIISLLGAVLLAFISTHTGARFGWVLAAFFVVALGFSLQQTAAQPFALALGDPSTGAHRLNLAGGVNSFGTLLGPLIVSIVLFGSLKGTGKEPSLGNIKLLWLILGALFALVALFFAVSKKLPKGTNEEHIEKSPKATVALILIAIPAAILLFANNLFSDSVRPYMVMGMLAITLLILFISMEMAKRDKTGWGAMQFPQLVLGMVAIFVYVGVEVTIQSNMGALLKTEAFGNMDEKYISSFISLYWGSLMIGRWTGAITVFNLEKKTRQLLTIIVPVVAFGIILLVNILRGNEVSNLYLYIFCILVLIAGIFYGQEKPAKTLLTLGILGAIAMLVGIFTKGMVATYAFMSGGLFCSVMWPCIFALAVAGLGKYTSEGSAFLIMMILGGAIIPPAQGALADTRIGIHDSYYLAVACFLYLAWHAWQTRKVLKRQGLDYDTQIGGGH
ncbi:MAG: MFS transporter [Chitinophagaceae bacterium]|nr:MFS transporter [Chitinophagaceae bacterium]